MKAVFSEPLRTDFQCTPRSVKPFYVIIPISIFIGPWDFLRLLEGPWTGLRCFSSDCPDDAPSWLSRSLEGGDPHQVEVRFNMATGNYCMTHQDY